MAYEITQRRMIVPNIHELTVKAPEVAATVLPGQFVIVMVDDRSERVPQKLVLELDAARDELVGRCRDVLVVRQRLEIAVERDRRLEAPGAAAATWWRSSGSASHTAGPWPKDP